MARLNQKQKTRLIYTAEGAKAVHISPLEQLRRLVLASLLWEDSFYVDGKTVAEAIHDLIPQVKPEQVAELAVEARREQKLRHMPLLLVRELARLKTNPKGLVSATLPRVIQRVDELDEFLAIYWKDGKQPLAAQVKKGLAAAFANFDAYQLAKYRGQEGAKAIRTRDVAFLVHPKPLDKEQAKVFARLLNKDHFPVKTKAGFGVAESMGDEPFAKLATADTWEHRISNVGGDSVAKTVEQKRDQWIEMLADKRLGAMALLRNLRNMIQAGVDDKLIRAALQRVNPERVLPFRFFTAAKYAPRFEPELEEAMLKCLAGIPKLAGKTKLVVDNSGSMYWAKISNKSELLRADAACALAVLLREICETVEIIVFSDSAKVVRSRRGMALRDEIMAATPHGGTNTGAGKAMADRDHYDRIILLTDEQSHTKVTPPYPGSIGYCINVANEVNGIGYGAWHHIDGWSESVINYIAASENQPVPA